jgi:hypothetical protein
VATYPYGSDQHPADGTKYTSSYTVRDAQGNRISTVYYYNAVETVTKRITGKTDKKGNVTLKVSRPADADPNSPIKINAFNLGFTTGEYRVSNQSEKKATVLNFSTKDLATWQANLARQTHVFDPANDSASSRYPNYQNPNYWFPAGTSSSYDYY